MGKWDYIISFLIIVAGFSLALFVWNKSPGQLEVVATTWQQLQNNLTRIHNDPNQESMSPGVTARTKEAIAKMESLFPAVVIQKYIAEHNLLVVLPLEELRQIFSTNWTYTPP